MVRNLRSRLRTRIAGVRLRRPSLGSVLGLTALIVSVSGVAYAAIPETDGVIHGCYAKHNGALRVIDTSTGAACKGNEVALPWSQSGPPGPPGPSGATVAYYGRQFGPGIQLGPDLVTVASVTVPAGNYSVVAKGGAFGGGIGTCELTFPPSLSAIDAATVGSGFGTGVLMTASGLPLGGTIAVQCFSQVDPVSADDWRITAIKVDQLNP